MPFVLTLHVLKNKTIVSAELNKIKRSFYVTVLPSKVFVQEYLQNKVVDPVYSSLGTA